MCFLLIFPTCRITSASEGGGGRGRRNKPANAGRLQPEKSDLKCNSQKHYCLNKEENFGEHLMDTFYRRRKIDRS